MDNKILKRIELIVFDLDGTLLSGNNTIGKKTIEYVEELKKMGVQFSIASGRLHSAVVDHAATLKLKTPLISSDGLLIKSYPENNIIFESYIPEKQVFKAVKLANHFALKIALCHDNAIYYTEDNASIAELHKKFGAKYQKVKSYRNLKQNTLEIILSGNDKASLKKVYNKFSFPNSFGLSKAFYKSKENEEIYYLEIKKNGSTKATGFKKLAKHLKVKTKNSAVMGDWYNDIPLFETNAIKIAVANAVPQLKELADFITKNGNNEDAAADFLEMVIKSKR